MTMFFFGILYALFVSLVNYFGMFLSVKSLMALQDCEPLCIITLCMDIIVCVKADNKKWGLAIADVACSSILLR